MFGFDPSSLSYDQRVIEMCKKKREQGYRVVLCTGSLHEIAIKIQEYLGIFDDVVGTDKVNNTGSEKVKTIQRKYPDAYVEYIGNSQDDVPLFEAFNSSFLINYKEKTLRAIKGKSVTVIGSPVCTFKNYFKMLRPHQWSKNVLAFVALISSHSYFYFDNILFSFSAFFCLSLCASSHYIVNDILDIVSDRQHETKRYREIPAGNVSLLVAMLLSFILMLVSLCVSYFINVTFFMSILAYLVITNIYSFVLKRELILDVVCLAILFTIRVVSGALAIDVDISPWLLSTSFFFFF
ncbi:UbiA family prenyltransferase [Photobacterium leiognathi]|uniref:UbiA family prenyltransferase n=1 Tax=Photobacterium leiognathi TaxID=553611 RepID=UPI002734DAEB|nr:UbiA family prenyltransferase [Photobacterium leiognathi]